MIIFVSDMFVDDYVGGAELTTEALILDSLIPIKKIHSHSVNVNLMESNKDKVWIFGNFSNLKEECILFAAKYLKYSVLEYDYKYCVFRSPEKHINNNGSCDCESKKLAKLISVFYKRSMTTWYMSYKQRQKYTDKFSFLNCDNNKVLSSVFSRETLDYIKSLNIDNKNNKWVILNSPSWIKGVNNAIEYAKNNNLKYELIWNLSHRDFLKKMSESKGVIYLPPGGDTCPRFIIEAKILGCELVLNDNVQHKNEAWFSTRENILKYLENRTRVFWSDIENKWYLETPKHYDVLNKHKFNIIVPFYNAEKWIPKCIKSVKNQTHENFMCYLINDMSTDNSSSLIEELIKDDDRFILINNHEKRYALGNIVNTIVNFSHNLDDINIILDGDDWLSSYNVLSYLDDFYTTEECLMTYGSYVYYPNGNKGVEPSQYPVEVIEANSFRKDSWRASHLRTFKSKLFSKLNLDDLIDDDGGFYKTAYDQALMLPLLEMAGHKAKYIDKILLVYNRANPLNVDKVKQRLQYETAQKVRLKKPYERLF